MKQCSSGTEKQWRREEEEEEIPEARNSGFRVMFSRHRRRGEKRWDEIRGEEFTVDSPSGNSEYQEQQQLDAKIPQTFLPSLISALITPTGPYVCCADSSLSFSPFCTTTDCRLLLEYWSDGKEKERERKERGNSSLFQWHTGQSVAGFRRRRRCWRSSTETSPRFLSPHIPLNI